MHNKSLGESVVAFDDAKPDHLEIVYTAKNVIFFLETASTRQETTDDSVPRPGHRLIAWVQESIVAILHFNSTPRLSQHFPQSFEISRRNRFHSAVVSKAFTYQNDGCAGERALSDPCCLSRMVGFIGANTSFTCPKR
jgi:hypothetical protein